MIDFFNPKQRFSFREKIRKWGREEIVRGFLNFFVKTRRRKFASLSLLVLLAVIFLFATPVWTLYSRGRALKSSAEGLQRAVVAKDLRLAEASVGELNQNLRGMGKAYKRLIYLRLVPLVNRYYRDGEHILRAAQLAGGAGEVLVETLEPYGAVLGLSEGFGSQITAEQQLENLVATLPELAAGLDVLWSNLGLIREEIDGIDPRRYPEEWRGVKVRFWLAEVRKILSETRPLVAEGRTILELAPQMLGSPKRTYLVVLQNDAELRATGGFITGISLVTLESGRILKSKFRSCAYIAKTQPYEKPPSPLGRYLGVGTWHFQDGNYSPDFPTTAAKLVGMWKKSKLPPVVGVVALNTQAASKLLELTGPIRVPNYDLDLASKKKLPESCRRGGQNFTSENLVCRLEFYVEKNPHHLKTTEERKIILGKLSKALIEKITTSPAEIWPQLVDLTFELLAERNLVVYAVNNDEQTLIKKLGYAGEILDFPSASSGQAGGDYLHISDSNFGGKKTDMFMQEKVEQVLTSLEGGRWQKTVEITYYNPQPHDNWLSAGYKDFVRLYVPEGSKLVRVEGAVQEWESWEEFGKTVFGAYFTLWPQREHTLTFVYDLPDGVVGDGEYSLLMQKQSGTNIGLVELKIGGKMKSFDLNEDRYVGLRFE